MRSRTAREPGLCPLARLRHETGVRAILSDLRLPDEPSGHTHHPVVSQGRRERDLASGAAGGLAGPGRLHAGGPHPHGDMGARPPGLGPGRLRDGPPGPPPRGGPAACGPGRRVPGRPRGGAVPAPALRFPPPAPHPGPGPPPSGGRRPGPAIGFQDAAPLHVMHRETLLSCAAEHGARLFLPRCFPRPTSPRSPRFPRCAATSPSRGACRPAAPCCASRPCVPARPVSARGHAPGPGQPQLRVHAFPVHERHDDPFADGTPFYPPWAAPSGPGGREEETGLVPLPFRPRRYVPEFSLYLDPRDIKEGIPASRCVMRTWNAAWTGGEGIRSGTPFPRWSGSCGGRVPRRIKWGSRCF